MQKRYLLCAFALIIIVLLSIHDSNLFQRKTADTVQETMESFSVVRKGDIADHPQAGSNSVVEIFPPSGNRLTVLEFESALVSLKAELEELDRVNVSAHTICLSDGKRAAAITVPPVSRFELTKLQNALVPLKAWAKDHNQILTPKLRAKVLRLEEKFTLASLHTLVLLDADEDGLAGFDLFRIPSLEGVTFTANGGCHIPSEYLVAGDADREFASSYSEEFDSIYGNVLPPIYKKFISSAVNKRNLSQ
jgi:hypothetical protein